MSQLDDGGDAFAIEVEETVRIAAWQPRPWWAWLLALVAAGLVALLVGGVVLAGADFGTSLRARGCDASAVPGLVLLALGASLVVAGHQFARLQHPEAFVMWEWRSLVVTLPAPVLLVAATLPGVLGCAAAADIAQVGLVGDALVGAPGLLLAGAAATLVGAAFGGALQVAWQVSTHTGPDEPPGIVELAMQEAEALEHDASATRFHGVDSE